MTNITIKVVKKKLLCIIKKKQRNNKIKKREKDRHRSMIDIERNEKKRKSLERYYKLKAQYKE